MKYVLIACAILLAACSNNRKKVAHYKEGCWDVTVYEGNDTVRENNCDDSDDLYLNPQKGTITPAPATPGSGRPNVPL
ncbi:MAG: hypothetical protein EOP56_02970 [Sphingobacteriales bacterium]|nr:MAG: hypothetical protein EOP56_02970 [Sphingobacteriales bacterium]